MHAATIRLALLFSTALIAIAGCGPPDPDRQAQHREIVRPAEQLRAGNVVLGGPSLTAGISGSGPLTPDQARAWLADERNHEELQWTMPLGLEDFAPLAEIPEDNPLTRAKIELGRQLYYDVRLSRPESFACGDCHLSEVFSSALVMPEIRRSVSVGFNRMFSTEQFWMGQSPSLETQAIVPISDPFEMDSSPETATRKVAEHEAYQLQFEKIFGEVTFDNICYAMACFQRVIIANASPWDYYRHIRTLEERGASLTDDERQRLAALRDLAAQNPLSDEARRGEELFFSDRLRCGDCHSGPNLTDEQYYNLGVGQEFPETDLHHEGRYRITKDIDDYGAFKTPTLRNIAHSAPYMHNGDFDTLEDAVDFVLAGGYRTEHLSELMSPVRLDSVEKIELLAFLRSLSSPVTPVEKERLPE
ncbi:MAG: cytochrome c peroxidase [Pirellulaceae bacterium]|jgi:cytochrome c peroxidase|nr:cytochrome c peroxidase [Pirellulaceae bacterium]